MPPNEISQGPCGLLQALRGATAAQHRALDESGIALRALATLEKYGASIAMLWEVHAVVERDLEPLPELARYGFDLPERRKTGFLERDAAALRERGIAVEFRTPQTAHPFRDRPARAVGAFYVLEGSTLGGTLLQKAVRERLGFESAYFGCYGQAARARWAAFQQALSRFEAGRPTQTEEVISGARATFELMREQYESIAG